MHEEDRLKNKKFVVKAKDAFVFYESSEFCAKIYNKLINGDTISDAWLINELDYMLEGFENETTSQPEKINIHDKPIQHTVIKRRRMT